MREGMLRTNVTGAVTYHARRRFPTAVIFGSRHGPAVVPAARPKRLYWDASFSHALRAAGIHAPPFFSFSCSPGPGPPGPRPRPGDHAEGARLLEDGRFPPHLHP